MVARLCRMLPMLLAALALAGCAGGGGGGAYYGSRFTLVKPQSVTVADRSMVVTPPRAWNRVPRSRYDVRWEENWTLNGPILDGLSFIGGLPDGKAIVRQRKKDERRVPIFRADMTPPELTDMIESYYRIRVGAADFEMTGLAPRRLLGYPGFQFDYDYLSPNEVDRRGRAVGAIIGEELYLILLDGARIHYFDAALPDFEAIVETARLR